MSPTFDEQFDPRKVATFWNYIPKVYREMEYLTGRRPKWPQFIEAMTEEEVAQGECLGKGHGLYFSPGAVVKINADMSPEAIFLNFIHEHFHHILPEATDQEINEILVPEVYRRVTGREFDREIGVEAGVVGGVYER